MRRLLGVLGVAALLVASVQPVAARGPYTGTAGKIQPANLKVLSVEQGAKSVSGRLARSDEGLIKRTDGNLVNVMIKFDLDPVASYQGNVAGLAATSPGATGKSVKENSAAVGSYRTFLDVQARTIRTNLQRAVPGIRLGKNYLTAYGGVAAQLPANQAAKVAMVKGVAAVQYDAVNHPTATDSPRFVGATTIWPGLGGNTKAGQGVKLGVLDTGIWPEHPMLADPGIPTPPGGPYACDFGTGADPDLGAAFTCNDKLIGAYAFVDTNLAFNDAPNGFYCNDANTECTARDAEGHGTHTSTTAAGSRVSTAILLGVDRGPISGIAPGASLIMYRVCIANSCYGSDSVAAVEQAIIDDVDVINFSISGGANPYADPVELAFLDAYAAGIEVNASAGNSGPGAATSDHGGPWTTTVGASTLDRSFETTVHLAATGGSAPLTLAISGVSVTAGVASPTPVLLASDAPYSSVLCDSAPSGPTAFTGKILVCKRGGNARIDKGHNAYLGGATGFILYNQSASVTDQESDNHWLPGVQVQYNSDALATFVSSHTGVTAWWAPGGPVAAPGDVMASFSSRGPLGEFIKPDVTAPGVQILAGMTPTPASTDEGPPGEYYQAIAGTSMSSPHAAGVALLMKAAHPSWTPGQIKSAMMTTAVTSVVKEDGSTPSDPFDRGAGSIRANLAINPTVTFDVTAASYYGAASDPFSWINLNLPSFDAPNMPGKIQMTRTARNVTNTSQTLNITASAPNNSKITVAPSQITLAPYGAASFTITIDGQKLADGQYFGQVTLTPVKAGYNAAHLPVAFYKQPGDVSLSNSCAAPLVNAGSVTINKGDTASCEASVTNYTANDASVTLKVKAPNTGRLLIQNWSDGNKKGNGFIWNGVLDAALPPSVDALLTPGDGYVDISYLPGEGIFGDETIVNYDLTGAEVRLGDVTYNTLAVTSDGYLVFGGGDSGDLNFIPQEMPNPARPNAVVAPYWTDLDFSAGGDVYIGYDGCQLYFNWSGVPIYGTATTRSFEARVMTAACADTLLVPGGDYITMEYDSTDMGPSSAPDGLNVGAEDSFGLTAADLGVDLTNTVSPNTAGYYVDTGITTPGGTKTITYDAYGKKTGNFDVKALMTSDATQGTAIQIVKVHVIP